MEEGVTIEEGIGDTNMLEIVLVELVGISIVFRSARTSCRTFDVPSRPVPSATIFPEFIDEL